MQRDGWSHDKDFTIGVLGPLLVIRDGTRRKLPPSRKTRGLLAYLALTARACRREELCDLLWEGAADPRGELRWSLAKIRAAIGPSLKSSSDGIALACDELSIDAFAFRDLAREAACERSIADALAIWRGPPLADVDVPAQQAFQAWLAAERDSLTTQRTRLLKAAVDRAWAHPEEALSAARRFVALEPWNEWGHARVSQSLERCGRPIEAAAYLASTRQSLSRELGIPEAELLRALPPPAPQTGNGQVRNTRPIARHVVRLEPLRVLPAADDLARLGVQVTASLGAELWRSHACDVLDGDPSPRSHLTDRLNADFALRCAVVRWGDTTQFSLRCVSQRSLAVLWSGQIELKSPFTRGLTQWIKGAVDAIGAAVRAADSDTGDGGTIRGRLMKARALAGALQPESNRQALALLNQVLADNADQPDALALAAWSHAQRAVYNWSANPDQDRLDARQYAAAATRAGIDDPDCLTMIAAARTLVTDRNGAGVLLDRALRLDAQSSAAHIRSGWLANYIDEPARALRHFRTAIRLAPLDPACFNALTGLGVAHFIRGDYTRAIRGMEQALALNPKAIWIHRNLVPAYAAAGDWQKAEDGVAALVKDYPLLTVASVCNAMVFSPAVMTQIADGLGCVGLPRA